MLSKPSRDIMIYTYIYLSIYDNIEIQYNSFVKTSGSQTFRDIVSESSCQCTLRLINVCDS